MVREYSSAAGAAGAAAPEPGSWPGPAGAFARAAVGKKPSRARVARLVCGSNRATVLKSTGFHWSTRPSGCATRRTWGAVQIAAGSWPAAARPSPAPSKMRASRSRGRPWPSGRLWKAHRLPSLSSTQGPNVAARWHQVVLPGGSAATRPGSRKVTCQEALEVLANCRKAVARAGAAKATAAIRVVRTDGEYLGTGAPGSVAPRGNRVIVINCAYIVGLVPRAAADAPGTSCGASLAWWTLVPRPALSPVSAGAFGSRPGRARRQPPGRSRHQGRIRPVSGGMTAFSGTSWSPPRFRRLWSPSVRT